MWNPAVAAYVFIISSWDWDHILAIFVINMVILVIQLGRQVSYEEPM